MSYTQVPSLVTFAPLTTILSADVNSNNAALRNVINGVVVGANAIAADSITEVTVGSGVTVNKKWTVSAGLATFASGISISGGTILASGITVSGIVTFSSGMAISAGTILASGITVSGAVTFSSGVTISSGTTVAVSGVSVTGVATFTTGINFTAGGAAIVGTTDAQSLTFKTNNSNRWSMSSIGDLVPVTSSAVKIGDSTGAIYVSSIAAAILDTSAIVKTAGNTIWALSTPPNIVQQSAHFVLTSGVYNFTTATLATSATIGYIFIPAIPGSTSGVPSLAASGGGGVALAYDTANNRLQVYSGGGWKTVLLA